MRLRTEVPNFEKVGGGRPPPKEEVKQENLDTQADEELLKDECCT